MTSLLTLFAAAPDPVPTADGTVAGYAGFAVFLGLAIAVGLLGWSLTRHLRKAKLNADDGLFGDVVTTEADTSTNV